MKFHDIRWNYDPQDPGIEVLTEDGVKGADLPFDPYFYVRQEDLTGDVISSLGDQLKNSHVRGEPIEDYFHGELYKVRVKSPKHVTAAKEFLHEQGIETLQSDIPYSRRMMIDEDWTVTSPDDMLCYDIEVAAGNGVPDPEEAAERILTICAIDEEGNEYTFAHDDERETLRNFFSLAEEYKCIIGWNTLTFDWPYLLNRAERLSVSVNRFKIINLDGLPIYRDVLLMSQNSYKLENVVAEEFEEDFYEFEDVDYAELETYFHENPDRLIEYNLEDVRAVWELNQRYRFKTLIFDILAGEGYCRPEDVFYVRDEGGYQKVNKSSTALVEGVIINESLNHDPNVIWPNKKDGSGDKFQGAKVLEPKAGLHDNVAVLDFSSMYPAIIEALNVGPETWREEKGDINAPIGTFVSEPESKIRRAYRRIQEKRNEWKAEKKEASRGTREWYVANAYDRGLKAIANTFYGVLGSTYARFYDRNVAENITRMGQRMLQKTEELADESGVTVLYGDTDSVLIKLGECDDRVDYGHELAEKFTEEIKDWIAEEYNGDPDLIELTLDEIYSKFFITDAKKRYAGICVWAGSPCETFERTGFESVRGDWPTATQDFQEKLLKRILEGEKVFDVVDEYRERLFQGELDEEITKNVGLSKPPSEYKSTPPHVRVARRQDMSAGDEVEYLKYGRDPKDVVWAGDDTYKDYLTYSAYRYIWDKNFMSIVDRLGLERHDQENIADDVESTDTEYLTENDTDTGDQGDITDWM